MISVYVPDVGDGLAMGIRTLGRVRLQVDCGSQRQPSVALEKGLLCIDPSVFVLSHFHADHYNGLLEDIPSYGDPCPRIGEVLYPRLPDFPQRNTFLHFMLAMNHWVLGDTSGSAVCDFLGVLRRINHAPFKYRSVSIGDTVHISGTQYDVLWPPKVIDDTTTLKAIETAIKDFGAAAEEDPGLRRILANIGESGEMRPYLEDETGRVDPAGEGERVEGRRKAPREEESRLLPPPVRKANESLRAAANHLSLAFHEDNKLLFMGDLERHEIKIVAKTLAEKQRDHFFVTITPHHGTHWQNDLSSIRTCYAISSVGRGLFHRVSPEFKSMADIHLMTYLNGDVQVPGFFPTAYAPGPWGYWQLSM